MVFAQHSYLFYFTVFSNDQGLDASRVSQASLAEETYSQVQLWFYSHNLFVINAKVIQATKSVHQCSTRSNKVGATLEITKEQSVQISNLTVTHVDGHPKHQWTCK